MEVRGTVVLHSVSFSMIKMEKKRIEWKREDYDPGASHQ